MQPIPDNVLLGAYGAVPGMASAPGDPTQPETSDGRAYTRPRRRKPTRYTRSADQQHPWETAASELERFLAETPQKLADALMPKGRAPFTADAPKAEQVDFWLTRFRFPDGTLNQPAIQDFLTTADPVVIHGLAKAIRDRQEAGQ